MFQRGNGQIRELDSFQPGERVAYASVKDCVPLGSKDGPRVLAVCLYTSHGGRFLGQATKNEFGGLGRITKDDDEEYEQVLSVYVDSPLSKGTFKGFFGRSDESAGPSGGIWRLGLIWGDLSKPSSDSYISAFEATAQAYDYSAQTDGPKKQITYAQAGIVKPSQRSPSKADFANVVTQNSRLHTVKSPGCCQVFPRLTKKKDQLPFELPCLIRTSQPMASISSVGPFSALAHILRRCRGLHFRKTTSTSRQEFLTATLLANPHPFGI